MASILRKTDPLRTDDNKENDQNSSTSQRVEEDEKEEEEELLKTPKYKKNPLVYRDPNETPPGEWTQNEIDALLNGVQKYQKGQWVQIKSDIQFRGALCNRTTVAMASKYLQLIRRKENERNRELKRKQKEQEKQEKKLLPRKKNRPREAWTSEEDSALMSFVEEYGQRWEKIRSENVILEPPPIHPSRTRGALCNRYKFLMSVSQNGFNNKEKDQSFEPEDSEEKNNDENNEKQSEEKLSENNNYNKWNNREDMLLLQYAIKYNQDWNKIKEAIFEKIRLLRTADEYTKRYHELIQDS